MSVCVVAGVDPSLHKVGYSDLSCLHTSHKIHQVNFFL